MKREVVLIDKELSLIRMFRTFFRKINYFEIQLSTSGSLE
jgi:hypothetical protein